MRHANLMIAKFVEGALDALQQDLFRAIRKGQVLIYDWGSCSTKSFIQFSPQVLDCDVRSLEKTVDDPISPIEKCEKKILRYDARLTSILGVRKGTANDSTRTQVE